MLTQPFLSLSRLTLLVVFCGVLVSLRAEGQTSRAPASAAAKLAPAAPQDSGTTPLYQLGVGDTVTIVVFGQPDLGETVYISDDGTMPVALAGPVQVAGLSPAEAAKRIERALRDGRFVNDPHVTLTVGQTRSQRVSVLGEVGSQNRYPIDSKTTIFDLLALAGGLKDTASDVLYVVRTNPDGTQTRYPVELKGMREANAKLPFDALRGGDVIFVPKAEAFYIFGEVHSPSKYRIQPDMTVLQAIAMAGGVTPAGSMRRIVVDRKDARGKTVTTSIRPEDPVRPDDVIRVKESIF